MRTIRAIRTAGLFALALAGPGFSGGCGESGSTENGKVLAEDTKVAVDREKMIQDMYKNNKAMQKGEAKK